MEKFTNIIGFILLITSIFVFGLKGMSVEMGIAVAASSIFLAFANLHKFSKFKYIDTMNHGIKPLLV